MFVCHVCLHYKTKVSCEARKNWTEMLIAVKASTIQTRVSKSLVDFEIPVVKVGSTCIGHFLRHLNFRHFPLVLLN